MVKQQASASARTMCLQVSPPASVSPSFGPVSHPVMQLSVGEPGPQKTEILSIPLPPRAGFYPVASPELLAPAAIQQPAAPDRRRWRSAGALVAGVAAGLLFAMLVVFVLGRTKIIEPSADAVKEPALVQKAAESTATDETKPDDPMFMLTP
jgi:hypothetical protein